MAKSAKLFVFTPVGTAEPYCSIQKPDYGNPEKGFGNPRGIYKVNLTIANKDCGKLTKLIDKMYDENWDSIVEAWENGGKAAAQAKLGRGKKLLEPYQGDKPYIDNGDGTTTFKFSGYASYIDKEGNNKAIQLGVVDTKGKRLDVVPAIAGGSKLKVRFSPFAYGFNPTCGASVKLQLASVMLVELREFGSNGDEWAEETMEGGYEAEGYDSDWSQGNGSDGDDGEDSGDASGSDF